MEPTKAKEDNVPFLSHSSIENYSQISYLQDNEPETGRFRGVMRGSVS